jgi:DNA-binding response OmpR family regulator
MDKKINILVIDDDPDILDTVEFLLGEAGYQVTTAMNGDEAISKMSEKVFDLAVIDMILPGSDGLTLTRKLKEENDTGVIILSGLKDTTDRIVGLEVGADDYVTKPFDNRELLARVRSVLRRVESKGDSSTATGDTYIFEGWALNASNMKLTSPKGEPVELTSGEFNLLQALVERANMVLTRDQLLDHTHQNYTPAFDRSVDVQIGRLRKKIETDPKKPQLIKTIRNTGYMFTTTVTRK